MNYKKIKEVRKQKKLTLLDMSLQTGYTQSFISQLERGMKNPSLKALRKISECLDVPLFTFLLEENSSESPHRAALCGIIRADQREKVVYPEILTEYELLTPGQAGRQSDTSITGVYIRLKPGEQASENLITHNYDESILILAGSVTAYIGGESYTLYEGDSIYIYANTQHNFKNNDTGILSMAGFMAKPV